MKYPLLTASAALLFLASCQGAPDADEAAVGTAQKVEETAGASYAADLAQSSVTFTGTKPVGQHQGTFNITEGALKVDGQNITGGRFVMDVSSLKIVDKDTAGSSTLRGHLSGNDFFDVAKYPTAVFEITKVVAGATPAAGEEVKLQGATHTVTGNLTMKDTTRSITFPARVQMMDGQVIADADFNIDRTQWHMVYGNDEGLGDKFIRPEVNLVLHLVAKK